MPARKKAPARKRVAKRTAKRKAPVRRTRKDKGPTKNVLGGLLLFSLACLSISIYMLIEEKRKKPEVSEMDRKVQEIFDRDPHAEVFTLEEPSVKKK